MTAFALNVVRMAVWLIILTALFVPLERLFAVDRQRVFRKQFLLDIAYYFLNSIGTIALLAFPMAVLAAILNRFLPASMLAITEGLPFWVRVIAALIVGEIGFYWGHRWSHEIPFLWRFHSIHHSAEHVDFLSNTRAHPVDIAFTRLCGFVPLYAVGLARSSGNRTDLVPLIVVFVGTLWGFFIHANVRWRFGWLENVLSTPAFHRWHHTNDAHRDHNYASMLPIFDRIFGTYYVPKAWPTCYGIDDEMSGNLVEQLVAIHPARPRGVLASRRPNKPKQILQPAPRSSEAASPLPK